MLLWISRRSIATDKAAALHWEEIAAAAEGGEVHANVIRRCLGCSFGPDSTDLANEELLQAVHDSVVEPLQRLFAVFTGYGPP